MNKRILTQTDINYAIPSLKFPETLSTATAAQKATACLLLPCRVMGSRTLPLAFPSALIHIDLLGLPLVLVGAAPRRRPAAAAGPRWSL